MESIEWRKLLRECLDSTIVGSLATEDSIGPYSCPIYFIYDDNFNIYFISSDSSRHINNLRKNPNVCISVYDPNKATKDVQVGIEIIGTASEVPEEKLEDVYMERNKRITGITMFQSDSHEGHFVKAHHGVFIMIKPANVYYVNTNLFGSKVMEIPANAL